ncbi:hypothetical protein [Euzebya rosea]|uniref:hypothetical protein n=1 Tax=Euzebya rosea TaxID=2052804 RepID=UPI000D3E50E2|nr:hypothetical protein [Euzebya rosea]
MDNVTPKLRSITGVARALIATVGVDEAVTILVTQFGWDVAFSAMSHVEGPEGSRGMWLTLERAGTS